MSDAERLAGALRATWRRRAEVVERIDGLLVTLTCLPDQEQNVAFVEETPRDPAGAILRAEELFAAHDCVVGIDLERGRFPGVAAAARTAGLRVVVTRPGMVIGVGHIRPAPPRPSVEVREVRDASAWSSFVDIQCAVFEMDRDVVEGLSPLADVDAPDVRMYLGLYGGRPAAVAIAYLIEGTAGIFGVGTLSRMRRRGLGEAVTARAIADAAPYADIAWLQSSSDGRPLYDRMGFRVVDQWDVWSR